MKVEKRLEGETDNPWIQSERARLQAAEFELKLKERDLAAEGRLRELEERLKTSSKESQKQLQQNYEALAREHAEIKGRVEGMATMKEFETRLQKAIKEDERIRNEKLEQALRGSQAREAEFVKMANKSAQNMGEALKGGYVPDVAKYESEITKLRGDLEKLAQNQKVELENQAARQRTYEARVNLEFQQKLAAAVKASDGKYEEGFQKAKAEMEKHMEKERDAFERAGRDLGERILRAENQAEELKQVNRELLEQLQATPPKVVEKVIDTSRAARKAQKASVRASMVIERTDIHIEPISDLTGVQYAPVFEGEKKKVLRKAEKSKKANANMAGRALQNEGAARARVNQLSIQAADPEKEKGREDFVDLNEEGVLRAAREAAKRTREVDKQIGESGAVVESVLQSAQKQLKLLDKEIELQEAQMENAEQHTQVLQTAVQEQKRVESELRRKIQHFQKGIKANKERRAHNRRTYGLTQLAEQRKEEEDRLQQQEVLDEGAANADREFQERQKVLRRLRREAEREKAELQEQDKAELAAVIHDEEEATQQVDAEMEAEAEAMAIAIERYEQEALERAAEIERLNAEIQEIAVEQVEVGRRRQRMTAERLAIIEAQRDIDTAQPRVHPEHYPAAVGYVQRRGTARVNQRQLARPIHGGTGGRGGAPTQPAAGYARQAEETDERPKRATRKRQEPEPEVEAAAPVDEKRDEPEVEAAAPVDEIRYEPEVEAAMEEEEPARVDDEDTEEEPEEVRGILQDLDELLQMLQQEVTAEAAPVVQEAERKIITRIKDAFGDLPNDFDGIFRSAEDVAKLRRFVQKADLKQNKKKKT